MSTLAFPDELVDLIIESIPLDTQDGRSALASCLLASKYLFIRARSRLFGKLEIDNEDIRKTTRLRKLLEFDGDATGLPRLSHCIKYLKMGWPPSAFNPNFDHEEFDMFFHFDDVAALLSVLARAQTLQALDMTFDDTAEFHEVQVGTQNHRDILRAICGIFSSPSLESLTLENFWSIPYDAFDIRRIKTLKLTNVTFSEKSIRPSSRPASDWGSSKTIKPRKVQQSQLRSFHYVPRPPLPSHWFISPSTSPFSRLHTLTVEFDFMLPDTPSSAFNSLLKISSDTLHTLNISFKDRQAKRDPEVKPVFKCYPHSLQYLTALHILKFTVCTAQCFHTGWRGDIAKLPVSGSPRTVKNWFGPTRDVVGSLGTLRTGRLPQTLDTIEVQFLVNCGTVDDVGYKEERDWKEVGDMLMSVAEQPKIGGMEGPMVGVALYVRVNFAAQSENLKVLAPFVSDFSSLWEDTYPKIKTRVVKVETWRDEFVEIDVTK